MQTDSASHAAAERVTSCRARLLAIPSGRARNLVCRSRAGVLAELNQAIKAALEELRRPIDPQEITDKDILRLPAPEEDATED